MISRETQSNFGYESQTGKNKRHVALLVCMITGSHSGPKLPEASHQTKMYLKKILLEKPGHA